MANFSGNDIQKHSYVYQVIQDILDGNKIKVQYKESGKTISKQVLFDPTPFKGWLALSKDQIAKKLKSGSKFLPVFAIKGTDLSLKWTQIDKSKYSGNIRKGDANSTAQQENCSLFIIEQVYKNKSYTLEDLKKIYPDIVNQPDWIDSFKAQEKVFKEIKQKEFNTSNLKYDRDSASGFMKYITSLVKKFGVRQKDTWNPADIWLYKEVAKKELQDSSTIEDLNHRMCKLFKDKILLGISLKKTGKTAKYELTNFKKVKRVTLEFIGGNLLLSLNPQKSGFSNDELNFDNKYVTDGITINSQVRMYPKIHESNVQISCKMKPKSKAELGKVPALFRNKVYKDLTGAQFPTGKSVPDSKEAFAKRQKEYTDKVRTIISKGIIKTGIRTADDFLKNVKYLYEHTDKSYHETEMVTKFQGLEIAYQMSKLPKKKLDELTTIWIYLAQKKGDQFGPFIKVF